VREGTILCDFVLELREERFGCLKLIAEGQPISLPRRNRVFYLTLESNNSRIDMEAPLLKHKCFYFCFLGFNA